MQQGYCQKHVLQKYVQARSSNPDLQFNKDSGVCQQDICI